MDFLNIFCQGHTEQKSPFNNFFLIFLNEFLRLFLWDFGIEIIVETKDGIFDRTASQEQEIFENIFYFHCQTIYQLGMRKCFTAIRVYIYLMMYA